MCNIEDVLCSMFCCWAAPSITWDWQYLNYCSFTVLWIPCLITSTYIYIFVHQVCVKQNNNYNELHVILTYTISVNPSNSNAEITTSESAISNNGSSLLSSSRSQQMTAPWFKSSTLCWKNAWSCHRSWMWWQRPGWHDWAEELCPCRTWRAEYKTRLVMSTSYILHH